MIKDRRPFSAGIDSYGNSIIRDACGKHVYFCYTKQSHPDVAALNTSEAIFLAELICHVLNGKALDGIVQKATVSPPIEPKFLQV